MIAERPLTALTQDALHILSCELGVIETVRFLRQFTRQALLGQKSLSELLTATKAQRTTTASVG